MSKKKTTKNFFNKNDILVLLTILIVALAMRMYKINTPLADWHSWRQVDTAAVARNFANDGFDLLRPRFDDFSNVQTGEYNPEGLRFVEFPLYNALFAASYKAAPFIPLEQHGRFMSSMFSLITIAVIYYLLRKEVSKLAAMAGASIYAVMPFFVYYSRVILPDTPAIACVFFSIFLLYRWAHDKDLKFSNFYYGGALVFAAVALLVKPMSLFYFLVLAAIFFRKYRRKIFTSPLVYIFFVLAVIPFGLWRYWITLFPVGGPGFEWLITSVNTFEGQKVIFMRPAFFRWVFYERILLLILGGWAGTFLALGAMTRLKKKLVIYSVAASALIYVLVFQGGNVQHDYYQIIILPAIAVMTGVGIHLLFDVEKKTLPRPLLFLAVLGIIGFSFIMSFETVKGYYNVDEGLLNTAELIENSTPKNALVVTDTFGDTTLLYNAHRKGMPAIADTLPNLKERGMQYFVTYSNDEAQKVLGENESFELIFSNEEVFLIKL